MTLSLVIHLPRLSVPTGTREMLTSLLPLAAPALLAAADAGGVGLPGRLLLNVALDAAEDALRA